MSRIILPVALFTVFPFTAHAYINAEVGSVLYQSIIAGIITAGALWRFCGKWIRDALKKFR